VISSESSRPVTSGWTLFILWMMTPRPGLPFNPFDLTMSGQGPTSADRVDFLSSTENLPKTSSPKSTAAFLRLQHRAGNQLVTRQDAAGAVCSPMETRNVIAWGQSAPHPVKFAECPFPTITRVAYAHACISAARRPLPHKSRRVDLHRSSTSRHSRSKARPRLGPSCRRRSLAAAGDLFRRLQPSQAANAVRTRRPVRSAAPRSTFRCVLMANCAKADPADAPGVAKALVSIFDRRRFAAE